MKSEGRHKCRFCLTSGQGEGCLSEESQKEDALKITNVRPWIVRYPMDQNPGTGDVRVPSQRTLVFVQVDTDEGITGWGEITTYPGVVANQSIAAYLREMGKLIVGDDPEQIEMIWHKIFREFTYVGTRGATTAAISGIDIALWDIRGKALSVTIYKLLSGKVRDRVALYCHPYWSGTFEGITQAS